MVLEKTLIHIQEAYICKLQIAYLKIHLETHFSNCLTLLVCKWSTTAVAMVMVVQMVCLKTQFADVSNQNQRQNIQMTTQCFKQQTIYVLCCMVCITGPQTADCQESKSNKHGETLWPTVAIAILWLEGCLNYMEVRQTFHKKDTGFFKKCKSFTNKDFFR